MPLWEIMAFVIFALLCGIVTGYQWGRADGIDWATEKLKQ